MERRIEALYLHWEELLEASANKGKRLEEARDHQKFNQEVDIADSCISEKVRVSTCLLKTKRVYFVVVFVVVVAFVVIVV